MRFRTTAMHPEADSRGRRIGDSRSRSCDALYEPIITTAGTPLIETDIRTAELAKHACNAFLAHEDLRRCARSPLCERADADVDAVDEGNGSGPSHRAGRSCSAGLGYGGYCFPKDLEAFQHLSSTLGYDFAMLREVARISDEAVDAAVDKIRDALWNLDDKRIALLGLAFKPGTDDVTIHLLWFSPNGCGRSAPSWSATTRMLRKAPC